ncbi:glycerophosphoryl diester phosphodiesterase [Jatrophihabitans endophyticus]|uniref:Glycerophosphoryl diester phosphodiesterase n=1 Tax=Jatrophihabitans endophyticus TaxID=1206085 RepID=A0A1M5H045_9ACTN|nr:glycerophosphodiester phosphodiesterase family protein [Jatrophihabitans endophyticus]SHG09288.1 glycerophosphoryl diester phosphodiesterase [Jatrophihabitans endophyticus]
MTYRDRPGPLAVAHRGGAGLAAENTLAAFARSYALGVRYLETDVRCTADGQLVAFHDARLERVTSARGWVRSRTMAELATLAVRGGGPIVALDDVLAAFPDACLTVDVKDPAAVPALARLLHDTGAAARVCVAGARGTWLRALADRVGPQLSTALSWRELAHLAASRPPRTYGAAAFAHVPLHVGRVPVFRRDLLARAHDAGVRVLVWTVDDPVTMHRLLDDGVDGIITDRPDVLREVLIARGQWHAPDSREAGIPA